MEATKSKKSTKIAPNLNLDITATNKPNHYYLAIEIKRVPFDGVLRPLNLLQGMIWDEIIYGFILKTSKSLKENWKAMPKENKKALHHRFAVKYGTKEEMESFRDEVFEMDLGKKLKDGTKGLIKKALRQIPTSKRKKLKNIEQSDLSSYDKFIFQLSQFGIIFLMPVEEDKE